MRSEQTGELAAALAKAQAEISDAEKTRANPHLGSRYATLASVWEACRGPLTRHGLSVVQAPDGDVLVTTLLHASGQWVESRTPIMGGPMKNAAQAYGSGLTYARRYALAAMVGVAQDDDDGEGVGQGGRPPRREEPSRPAQRPPASPPASPPAEAGRDEHVEQIVEIMRRANASGDWGLAQRDLEAFRSVCKSSGAKPSDEALDLWNEAMHDVETRLGMQSEDAAQ